MNKKFLKLAGLVAVLALAGIAWAVDNKVEWNGSVSSGEWSVATNWKDSKAPTSKDAVDFSAPASVTVTTEKFNEGGTIVVPSLDVYNSAVTILLSPDFQVSGDLHVHENASLVFRNSLATAKVLLSDDWNFDDSKSVILSVDEGATLTFDISVDVAPGHKVRKVGKGELVFNGPQNSFDANSSWLSVDNGVLTVTNVNQLAGLKALQLSADKKTDSVTWNINGPLSRDLDVKVGARTTINVNTEPDAAVNFSSNPITAAGAGVIPSVVKGGTGTLTLPYAGKWEVGSLDIVAGKIVAKTSDPFKSGLLPDISLSGDAALEFSIKDSVVYLGALKGTSGTTVDMGLDGAVGLARAGKFEGTLKGNQASLSVDLGKASDVVELAGKNLYTGNTFIKKGVLKLSSPLANEYPSLYAVTFAGSASLDLGAGLTLTNPIKASASNLKSTIIVADGKEATLAGDIDYSGIQFYKAGTGTLILDNTDAIAGGIGEDQAVFKVLEGTLYAKNQNVFNQSDVVVGSRAVLEVENGLVFSRSAPFFQDGSSFKVKLTAANKSAHASERADTPAATFYAVVQSGDKPTTPRLTLIADLQDADAKSGDFYTVIFTRPGVNDVVRPASIFVSDPAGNNLTDTGTTKGFKVHWNTDGGKGILALELTKDVDKITLGDLTPPTAEPGKLYSGKIKIDSGTPADKLDYSPATGNVGLDVILDAANGEVVVSADLPADFKSTKFNVRVTTKGDADRLPATVTKEFTLTSSTTPTPPDEPTEVEADEALVPDPSAGGALFTQDVEKAKIGEPVTITFKIDSKYLPVTGVTALFDPSLNPVPVVTANADGTYSFTIPEYAAGQKWGFGFKASDNKFYRVEPTLVIKGEAPIGGLVLNLTAKPGTSAGEVAFSFGVYNSGVSPRNYQADYDVIAHLDNGTTSKDYALGKTDDKGLVDYTASGIAAGTYTVTATATKGSDVLTSAKVTVKVAAGGGSSSGGGCDAGFAGLALLLAAPLFLRKKSK